MKKNNTNVISNDVISNDEKSDATPDDPPVIAPSSQDNPEIADLTPENEELEINDENDGHTLELE